MTYFKYKEEWVVVTVWIGKNRYTIEKDDIHIIFLLTLLLILIGINILIK